MRSHVLSKPRLREQAAQTRTAAHAGHGAAAGDAIAARAVAALREFAPEAIIVSAYHSMRDEIDTGPLLRSLAVAGYRTALPVCAQPKPKLIFRLWQPGEPLVARPFGLLEPGSDHETVLPDAVFVPMLAFDKSGNRLGYGAGYYDAGLAALRAVKPVWAAGLAYDEQEMPAIPHESHDQRLDAVITPTRTLVFGA